MAMIIQNTKMNIIAEQNELVAKAVRTYSVIGKTKGRIHWRELACYL